MLMLLSVAACARDDEAGVTPATSPASVAVDRPNIVLVLTDDQDVGSLAYMPNVQKDLVQQGTTFTNAFVTTSLCCPSRTSTLTGRYAHNHGIRSNALPDGGFALARSTGVERSTVATWLHDAGYTTGFFGKYLNNYNEFSYVPPGWDQWVYVSSYQLSAATENGKRVKYPAPYAYVPEFLTQRAVAFVDSSASHRRPFMLMLWYKAPHAPATPAAKYAGRFSSFTPARTPSFNVIGPNLPLLPRQPLTPAQIAASDALYRARLESLLSVDDGVHSVIAALARNQLLDNTYIIYTSDNGLLTGEHAVTDSKNLAYEESIRVPFVVRGPGVRRNARRSHFVLNIDLAPTFADIAHAAVPPNVDGRSLKPLFDGLSPAWRRAFLVEHWGMITEDDSTVLDPSSRTVSSVGIRDRSALYVEWQGGQKEYYKLSVDPYELTNRAATNKDAKTLYAPWLAKMRNCAAAACRALEDAPPQ
jgi:N-acetylglucosamine-6-sulfatase